MGYGICKIIPRHRACKASMHHAQPMPRPALRLLAFMGEAPSEQNLAQLHSLSDTPPKNLKKRV